MLFPTTTTSGFLWYAPICFACSNYTRFPVVPPIILLNVSVQNYRLHQLESLISQPPRMSALISLSNAFTMSTKKS